MGDVVAPYHLHRGDRVAIVAPAAQFHGDELQQGLDVIRSCGLKPVLGPNVKNLRSDGVYDAPLEHRIKELMWAFTDPNIEAVWCTIGGFGSAEVLDHLDYNLIRRSRRPFVGKSDITAVNSALLRCAGLINFSGKSTTIRRSGKGSGSYVQSDGESLEHTLKLLMSTDPWHDRPFEINQFVPRCITPGRVSGRAIGGNLETLTCLLGTDYMPDPTGAILFLEDVHKSGVAVARALLHLKMAGVLDAIAGVVIGEFAETPSQYRAMDDPMITDTLQYYFHDIPCTYGYSFAHGSHVIPIPIGAMTHIDAGEGLVSFDFCMARR